MLLGTTRKDGTLWRRRTQSQIMSRYWGMSKRECIKQQAGVCGVSSNSTWRSGPHMSREIELVAGSYGPGSMNL